MGSGGVSVQTGNLESVLLGGVSFGLANGELPGEPVTERAYYEIYSSRSRIGEKKYEQTLSYVLLLDNSIEGMRVGDPVMLRGIKVGQVVHSGEIPTGGNLLDTSTRIPVRIEINPARLGMPDTGAGRDQASQEMQQWLQKGMNAVVKSTSPIFGVQIVQLNLPESPTETALVYYEEMPVIAVSSGSFDAITTQVAQLVDKISQLPIQDIGSNLDQLLAETTKTMASIQGLAATGDRVLADVDQEELIKSLNQTTAQLGELAASYSGNSPTNRELRLLLENLTYVLAELGPVLSDLKNQPNSLIFGGSREPEPEPERKPQ